MSMKVEMKVEMKVVIPFKPLVHGMEGVLDRIALTLQLQWSFMGLMDL